MQIEHTGIHLVIMPNRKE